MKRLSWILLSLLLFSSCSLQKSVHRVNKKGIANVPYDVIIVPGYPYKASEHKELFRIRLNWAKTIYKRGWTKNIIFSGGAVHTPYVEGEIMKLFAVKMRIPKNHIFVEEKAIHTSGNIKYGMKLAKKLGFKKVAFATDPFQFSYMKTLRAFLAPGTHFLTFPPDSMAFYGNPSLPKINTDPAYIEGWTGDKTEE